MNLSLNVYQINTPRQLKRVEKNQDPEIKLPHNLLKPGRSILKNSLETNLEENPLHTVLPPHKGLYYSSGYMAEKQLVNTTSGFNVII